LLNVDTDALGELLLGEALFLAQFGYAGWEAGSDRVLIIGTNTG